MTYLFLVWPGCCKHLENTTIGGLKSEKQFSLYCITIKRILKSGKIPAQNVKDLVQSAAGVVDYSILSSMDQLQVVWLILKVLFSLLTSQNCCGRSVYKSVNANLFPVRIPSCLLVAPGWVLLYGCWCWRGPAGCFERKLVMEELTPPFIYLQSCEQPSTAVVWR